MIQNSAKESLDPGDTYGGDCHRSQGQTDWGSVGKQHVSLTGKSRGYSWQDTYLHTLSKGWQTPLMLEDFFYFHI